MTLSSDQRWVVVGSGDSYEPERPAEVRISGARDKTVKLRDNPPVTACSGVS